MMRRGKPLLIVVLWLAAGTGWSAEGGAGGEPEVTVVRATGNVGEFDIQLLDPWTPKTVANFLGYVDRGDFSDSFIHRSVPGFIVQGGGFTIRSNLISPIANQAPVTNEPYFSNVRGTVAMAKMGGDPHSATSQWFINLSDNAANLDNQNGGFTVFGVVLGNGMAVADAIADVNIYDASPHFGSYEPSFSNLPLLKPVLDDAGNYVLFTNLRRLAAGTQVFPFDFTERDEGFVAGFADLPADYDPAQFVLQGLRTNLPPELGAKLALLTSGVNRSDDLWMFWKRKAVGLIPGMVYEATFDLELASAAGAGSIGAGGGPGESVFLKAGVSSIEPRVVLDRNGWLRLNIDKGDQSQPGLAAAVLGHAAKPDNVGTNYAFIFRDNRSSRIRATSAADGSLWFFFGSDSGFEGATSLYYTRFTAVLEPVGKNQLISFPSLANRVFAPSKTFTLSASNSSGLPVDFFSSDTNVVAIAGNVAAIKAAGSVTITATNSGNADYNPVGIARPITISKGAQTITFKPAAVQKFKKGRKFTLTASATSKLPVSLRSSNSRVLSVSGRTATIRGKGKVTVTGSQGGNANYRPARSVSRIMTIR